MEEKDSEENKKDQNKEKGEREEQEVAARMSRRSLPCQTWHWSTSPLCSSSFAR